MDCAIESIIWEGTKHKKYLVVKSFSHWEHISLLSRSGDETINRNKFLRKISVSGSILEQKGPVTRMVQSYRWFSKLVNIKWLTIQIILNTTAILLTWYI